MPSRSSSPAEPWDSRDNVFAPRGGAYALATASSDDALGSVYRFGHYTADARRYLQLGRGVLAGQAYLEATSGRAPFDQLALAGSGTILRGYARGRFRDRDLAAAQLEYRAPVMGRLGAAAFAEGADDGARRLGNWGQSRNSSFRCAQRNDELRL